ncbi:iron-sulfur cluster repair di-iron protein [Gracilibacillus salitolerans]|uniref:Iron-sulfur cluster repair di-iron protein n=1 Tax=Gracilibacillus salitolerans TaxID=2663022 RepID=A0A5Q2TP11_9BACI|nr:iron-sulfur cluster repair di-iron protein [Gracilibacillus salitolerans]QGH35842.1 iron-sulfur cluster repair di-iron protein [Gracilibacillus salitolerans]
MREFQLTDTPADIVKIYPKASDFFKKEKIDFCCGGDQPLQSILDKKKRRVDGQQLIGLINESFQAWIEAGNKEINWDNVSPSELVDYIMQHHHHYLHEELTPLSQFVTKIYRVHGPNHPHLEDLYKLFHQFKMEMEGHMIEEERDLFPLFEKYEEEPNEALKEHIFQLNNTMIDDHEFVGEIIQQMNEITNDYTLPEGACNSYRITYARLAELEQNTYQHIHLENNILFKSIS